jgi:hypothetical protein
VWDQRAGRQVWRTARTLTEGRQWRQDAAVAIRAGTLGASDGRTLKAVADEWLIGARSGVIRNRSGDPYKPSAVRGYEAALRLRVFPKLGTAKFTAIRRVDLQDVVDRLHAQGLSASSVQGSILPLRAMYRRALARGEVTINPTSGLEMPPCAAGVAGSCRPSRRASCSRRSLSAIGRCGLARCTPACAVASYRRSAGRRTSTVA